MQLEDYTPDNVCRAMGLSSFGADEVLKGEDEALRIVFLPSFHPEIVVTFRRSRMAASVMVNALEKRLWGEPTWALLPNVQSCASVENSQFEELLSLFNGAVTSLQEEQRGVYIDGMSIAACHYRGMQQSLLEGHVYRGMVGSFAKAVIEIAWTANKDSVVANALAAVAIYVRLDYPIAKLPPPPPVTNLLILGTPEARQEYFEMLAQAKAKRD